MNYLTIMIIYFISIFLIMMVVFFGRSLFQNLLINRPIKFIYQNMLKLVPDFLIKILTILFRSVFHERNYIFQAIYCISVLICHGILVLDVLSILYYYSLLENHVYIMILALFLNIVLYFTLCISDPGLLNKKNKNFQLLSTVYKNDQLIYKKQDCELCQTVKPARSAHCKMCEICVYRYDHHCIWSNCCIGGLNLRNFILFLISTFVMCANSVYLSVKSLAYFVYYEQLWAAKYLDSDGVIRQMDLTNLIQHLFMSLPRIMFLVTCLSGVGLGLLGYILYHFYLVFTNQTSLERFRIGQMMRKTSRNSDQQKHLKTWRPFDRGWKENVKEVVQPFIFVKKIK